MNETKFGIHTEFITLGQLIKAVGLIGNGGEIKGFLSENKVKINGETDQRRGRKVVAGDIVEVDNMKIYVFQKD